MKHVLESIATSSLIASAAATAGCQRDPPKAMAFIPPSSWAQSIDAAASAVPPAETIESVAPPPAAAAQAAPVQRDLSPEDWLRAAAAAAWSGERDQEWSESRAASDESASGMAGDAGVGPVGSVAEVASSMPLPPASAVPSAQEPPPVQAVASASVIPDRDRRDQQRRAQVEVESRRYAAMFGAGPGFTGVGAGDATFTGIGAGLSGFTGVGAGDGFTGLVASPPSTMGGQASPSAAQTNESQQAEPPLYMLPPVLVVAPVSGVPWLLTYPVF